MKSLPEHRQKVRTFPHVQGDPQLPTDDSKMAEKVEGDEESGMLVGRGQK